jgi:hypothetical protein
MNTCSRRPHAHVHMSTHHQVRRIAWPSKPRPTRAPRNVRPQQALRSVSGSRLGRSRGAREAVRHALKYGTPVADADARAVVQGYARLVEKILDSPTDREDPPCWEGGTGQTAQHGSLCMRSACLPWESSKQQVSRATPNPKRPKVNTYPKFETKCPKGGDQQKRAGKRTQHYNNSLASSWINM